jgi:hypothetical protein
VFSDQDTRRLQTTKAIDIAYLVTAASGHFKAVSSAPLGILSNTLQHVGIHCLHSCLQTCHEIWKGLHKCAVLVVPTGKIPSELDPATERAMQEVLDVKSIFLDKSRSTNAGHLPHSETELPLAETTVSAPQLEATCFPVCRCATLSFPRRCGSSLRSTLASSSVYQQQQHKLNCCRYWRLGACLSIRRECITWTFHHNSSLLWTVCLQYVGYT